MTHVVAAAWFAVLVGILAGWGSAARAQAQSLAWVQVEAQPDLATAQARARAYGVDFGNVAGFQLNSGWYAIMLGPFPAPEAAARLADLRERGAIPGDSYIATEGSFLRQFWPAGQGTQLAALPAEPVGVQPAAPPPATPPLADETVAQARAAEAGLATADRQLLQTALQWAGFYSAAIDGAFGPGTRAAMAAWQAAQGYEPTGVLTGAQRSALIGAYRADLAEMGMETVRDEAAGLQIDLPTGLVDFAGYEAPFVHYKPRGGSGVQVHLISQPGDAAALAGLYDILQTLEIVPKQGARERSDTSFVLTGESPTLRSYSFASLQNGLIKGYMLVWNPADNARMERVLAAMQASFAPFGSYALDATVTAPSEDQRRDLLAGLEVRRPALSRSGFYIDASGRVLTTADAVQSCARITLDEVQEARVTLTDAALGIALLTPLQPLSPPGYARFQTAAPRLNAEIAVAGYSYGDALSAPSVTFGRLEDLRGLDGEESVRRLTVPVLEGDAGGPVLDASGAVIGLLLPRAADGARVLPQGVSFAASTPAILAVTAAQGVTPPPYRVAAAQPPEDLADIAGQMTVLVSCWR